MSPPIGVHISDRQATAPVVRPFPGGAEPSPLELLMALQTTLELEPLLGIFSSEVGHWVAHQSLLYREPTRDLRLLIGRGGRHRCSFSLTLFQYPLGELTLYRSSRFSPAETTALERLVSQLAYPLRNALSYFDAIASAHRDPLTGVGNRAAFDLALAREVQLAQRHGHPLSLLACDIDWFKRVNDRYGHAVGDRVLQEVTAALRGGARGSDVVFRYGGEEFMVLLADTSSSGATTAAERLRQAVAHHTSPELPQVTVSIGVATLQAEEAATCLFERADAALYAAKRQGRNQVAEGA